MGCVNSPARILVSRCSIARIGVHQCGREARMAILPWAFEKDDCGEVQEVQYEVPAWWSAGGPERRMRGRRMATDGCRCSGEVISIASITSTVTTTTTTAAFPRYLARPQVPRPRRENVRSWRYRNICPQ
jgi:hypothetical protein